MIYRKDIIYEMLKKTGIHEPVSIDTSIYKKAHGKEPSGKGAWIFSLNPKKTPNNGVEGKDYFLSVSDDYRDAVTKAKQWAKGKSCIYLLEDSKQELNEDNKVCNTIIDQLGGHKSLSEEYTINRTVDFLTPKIPEWATVNESAYPEEDNKIDEDEKYAINGLRKMISEAVKADSNNPNVIVYDRKTNKAISKGTAKAVSKKYDIPFNLMMDGFDESGKFETMKHCVKLAESILFEVKLSDIYSPGDVVVVPLKFAYEHNYATATGIIESVPQGDASGKSVIYVKFGKDTVPLSTESIEHHTKKATVHRIANSKSFNKHIRK